MALNIFMGVSGSGRTHFIKENFPTWTHFSVGDYQKKILADMGNSMASIISTISRIFTAERKL